MSGIFKWFLMLNKRLYKKASFVAILAALLLCVCAFTVMASKNESGFIHVVLAEEEKGNAVSGEIIEKLLNNKSLLLFTKADSPEKAEELVKTGKADSAWIFSENTEQKITEFVGRKDVCAVTVIEREQNVLLRLSHEKLYSAVFEHSAKTFFISYARENIGGLDKLSDAQLLGYFENAKINDNLFIFDNPESVSANDELASNYLLSPLRGILAIVCVLGGIAAALYCIQDAERGTFARTPLGKRFFLDFACIFVATLNVSVISTAALCISGIYRFSISEAACMLCFALCSAAFCMLLKTMLGNIKVLSSVLPVLVIIMTCICPIFMTIKQLRLLALVFPPTYYVYTATDTKYILYMLLYSAVCLVTAFLLNKRAKHV